MVWIMVLFVDSFFNQFFLLYLLGSTLGNDLIDVVTIPNLNLLNTFSGLSISLMIGISLNNFSSALILKMISSGKSSIEWLNVGWI